MRLKIVTLMATCLFLIGCQQGNSTSGVDETDPYTQAQVETFVASATSGTVGVYSASSENNQTAFMKCKVKWVYMYKTKTYLSLKGCTWSWAYVTGTWRTQGAAVGTTAKSGNMWLWFNKTSATTFNYVVV